MCLILFCHYKKMILKNIEFVVNKAMSGFKLSNKKTLKFLALLHLQMVVKMGFWALFICCFILILVWLWQDKACWAQLLDLTDYHSLDHIMWGSFSKCLKFPKIAVHLDKIFRSCIEVEELFSNQDAPCETWTWSQQLLLLNSNQPSTTNFYYF